MRRRPFNKREIDLGADKVCGCHSGTHSGSADPPPCHRPRPVLCPPHARAHTRQALEIAMNPDGITITMPRMKSEEGGAASWDD